MVRKTAITLLGDPELLSQIYQRVKDYIYPPVAKKCEYGGYGRLRVVLDEDSLGYQYILQRSQERKLHPYIAQAVYYTKKELETVEFFELSLSTPLEREGTTPADYGTQYIGGCPHCGLGQHLAGEVLIDRKFIIKHQIGRLYPEIFVSKEIKTLIQESGFTGVSFPYEVRDFKGRAMPEYYVMTIESTLPSMSLSAWIFPTDYPHQRYEKCGHQIKYHKSDSQYEREKLKNAKDFNLSCEYLNNFRMQKIIVSARVRKFFKEHKISVGYVPVTLL